VQYVAVIAASSAASRIVVYKFTRSETDNELQLWKQAFYRAQTPGLSWYLDNPNAGERSIRRLLDDARGYIPAHKLPSTQLVLRWTGGMRRNSETSVDRMLKVLRDLLSTSGFKVDDNAIEIAQDSDEGIFNWLTVNYLLGRLSRTRMLLSVGESSIAIAGLDENGAHTRSLNVSGNVIDMSIHSYATLDVQHAHYQLFHAERNADVTAVRSVCIHPQVVNVPMTFNNVVYRVSGKQNQLGAVDTEVCLELIRSREQRLLNPDRAMVKLLENVDKLELINPLIAPKPATIRQHWNKISKFTVADLRTQADVACGQAEPEDPLLCLEMLKTWALLSEAFGLANNTILIQYTKIYSHYVYWTLGCALKAINYVEFLDEA
ncbi:hypothetical protein KR222_009003, partial [Zaprionus bogoriensis]